MVLGFVPKGVPTLVSVVVGSSVSAAGDGSDGAIVEAGANEGMARTGVWAGAAGRMAEGWAWGVSGVDGAVAAEAVLAVFGEATSAPLPAGFLVTSG